MHTQTTGRHIHLFLSRNESPTCDCLKSVHRTVHINNGYLFCLIFFSCTREDHQRVELFLWLGQRPSTGQRTFISDSVVPRKGCKYNTAVLLSLLGHCYICILA